MCVCLYIFVCTSERGEGETKKQDLRERQARSEREGNENTCVYIIFRSLYISTNTIYVFFFV